jgi:2-keto-4-pentenoate hydratase/2-oxohepta-3-ene-1,7-dioic acid hydratase in catechol pathway
MRLKRFKKGDDVVIAAEYCSQWVVLKKLPKLGDPGEDMIALLDQWSAKRAIIVEALETEKENLPIVPDNATPMRPFDVRSLRDFMLYEKHAVDAARGMVRRFMPRYYAWIKLTESITKRPFKSLKPHRLWYRQPIYYFGNHLNLVGEGEKIPWPAYTRSLDYELEVAFVITRPLKNATSEQALAAIGGFMILNDVSARDIQVSEMRSGMGPQKAKHFINALSDELATADEILPHIDNLKAEVRINDQIVCSTSTLGMQFSIAEVLAHASKDEQLQPGELFATGTLPGGCALENGHWVKPGDSILMTIERIGSLNNVIAPRRSS